MSVSATRIVVSLSNAYRRVLAIYLGVIGPRASYRLFGMLGRRLYHLFDPLRERSEAQCRAALGGTHSAAKCAEIAERAFVHRSWNLADLMLAERLIHRGTLARYGGQIPEPYLGLMRDAQRRRRPLILVTGYYGPFDLLPLLLGYNGIRAAAVYLPHANRGFDAYRRRIRGRSGCEMVPVNRALSRLPEVLGRGGTAAILADHRAERRGIPVGFLGLATTASRTVGLLAAHYEAVVVVAGIRRRDNAFRFEIVVPDFFEPSAWRAAREPVTFITQRYVAALEKIVLADPTQYLWAYGRWGEDRANSPISRDRPGAVAGGFERFLRQPLPSGRGSERCRNSETLR